MLYNESKHNILALVVGKANKAAKRVYFCASPHFQIPLLFLNA